jgi:hypothetical protein
MTISAVEKREFLGRLAARRLPGVTLAVAQAIVERINHRWASRLPHMAPNQISRTTDAADRMRRRGAQ